MTKEDHKSYGMFNGRRDADQYVKGYLKGIALISGIGLTVFMAFVGWVVYENRQNRISINQHDVRITSIESSRFTVKDGQLLSDKINANTINFTKIESIMASVMRDLEEIKTLLRRSAPYERREFK